CFKISQGQGFGWCCLFAVYTVLFTLFRLKFSCITYLTSYHWTCCFLYHTPAPAPAPEDGGGAGKFAAKSGMTSLQGGENMINYYSL
ncbi:hypothetical protein LIZ94_19920, partial [Flavonifractor plautii]|uniref:hypothetical protein n=1 Tax=Flavonifractor plautii TaxID=292800 RepID=UPI001D067480